MGWKEKDPVKLYWSIGEISEYLITTTSAVRFWCDSFKLDLKRASNKSRLFSRETAREIIAIHYLLEVEMFTLKGAAKKLELWRKKKYVIPESRFSRLLGSRDDSNIQEGTVKPD